MSFDMSFFSIYFELVSIQHQLDLFHNIKDYYPALVTAKNAAGIHPHIQIGTESPGLPDRRLNQAHGRSDRLVIKTIAGDGGGT